MKVTSAAMLLAALGIGCVAPTEPVVPAGTFALQAFAAHPLPAVTFENSSVRVSSVADTVRIATDGTGVRRLTQRLEFLDGSRTPEEFRAEIAFTIRREGSRLVVAEQVVCALSHETEECGPKLAVLSGAVLEIGLRRYTRVADAP